MIGVLLTPLKVFRALPEALFQKRDAPIPRRSVLAVEKATRNPGNDGVASISQNGKSYSCGQVAMEIGIGEVPLLTVFPVVGKGMS